jgi:hypothetical protein
VPFYAVPGADWYPSSFTPASDEVVVAEYDFEQGVVDVAHDSAVTFALDGRPANAVRIAGVITLADGVVLGATNALNGDKYLAIEPVADVDKAEYRVRYTMGGGLGSFRFEPRPTG